MLNKIEFHPMFKPAMQLAFGKTLICRNMEIASQFAKSADLDCITMEGKGCYITHRIQLRLLHFLIHQTHEFYNL